MIGSPPISPSRAVWSWCLVLQVLPEVLSSFQPQLVLYDAGVDVHVDDDLGRLAVTDKGEVGERQL